MSRTPLAGVAALAVAIVASPTLVAFAGAPTTPNAAPATAAAPTLPTEALDILLTNDDGYTAAGINAVYDALTEAGHDVTMVAPAKNYSGVSASIQFSGTTEAVHPIDGDENKWGVDLSPAGTVLFALDAVLTEKPDLVISGTNVGSNTGFDTNFSGTIGAATVASGMQDIPAIAISTATAGYTHDAPGAFTETADLLVDLLDRGLPVLPRGQVLNINYPTLSDERPAPEGIAFTANSQASAAAFGYAQQDDETTDAVEYEIQGARGTETPAEGSDTDMLKKGWVTFGILDADRSVDAANAPAITALVRELNDEPEPPVAPGEPTIGALPTQIKKDKVVKVATTDIARGKAVVIRWEPIANGKAKTVKRTTRTKAANFKLKAPKQKGRYLVTVTVKQVKVADAMGVVRVK